MNSVAKRILIVDDELDILDIMQHILKHENFEVKTVSSPVKVMEVLDSYNPDLIFLDVMMPQMSGIELCKKIKAKYTIPIVFCSAHASMKETFKECLGDGFLSKPFGMHELISTANTLA